MRINVKIDKISLSTPKRTSDIYYNYKDLPGYKPTDHVDTSGTNYNSIIHDESDSNPNKYEKVIKFKHEKTGNSLIICHMRKKRFKRATPLYLIFYTNYYNKITYQDVIEISQFFHQMSIPLRISEVHIALDIISKNKIGLYDKIIMALKPGTKRQPNQNNKLRFDDSLYFGDLRSGNQLIVYDKATHLLVKKDIQLDEGVVRLELRMRMHKMNNFIRTIEELRDQDWSFIYPKYYSFHFRSSKLKKNIKAIGEDWRQPIWELRDIMLREHEVWPSNFYKHYLIDHPQLSVSIPKALSGYRWKDDVSYTD
jgi:hypothetical protein